MLADLKKARKIQPEVFAERDKWIYFLNNFHNAHKLKNLPSFMQDGSFDNVIDIAKKLKREKMEELMDFFSELHQGDRERAAEKRGERNGVKKGEIKGEKKWKREGEKVGIIKTIKNFISNCPKELVMTQQEIAELFKVEEELVKSLMPA